MSCRKIAWLTAVVVISVIVGAIVAPPVYASLIELGRNIAWLNALRDLKFERVWSRSVMVCVLVLGLATLKWSGLRGAADFGYPFRRGWVWVMLTGLIVGVVSMASLQLLGFLVGAYEWIEGWVGILQTNLFNTALGALTVGVIEEGFFRGLLLRIFSGGRRLVLGALISSILFSLVHFLKPEPPFGVAHVDWRTGFEMIAHLFSRLDGSWNTFPFALNLFLMGWALCALVGVRGDVYFVAGLHAGWVWVLLTLSGLVQRNTDRAFILFGPSADLAKSWLGTVVLLALAAWATWRTTKRVPGS